MPSPRTLVALATYNEIENLPGLVDEILRVLPDADLLVVDDNSPDGTGRWCDERAANEPRLQVPSSARQTRSWLCNAGRACGMHSIQSYDVFVTMDADWSHDPQYLPELVRATEQRRRRASVRATARAARSKAGRCIAES